MAERNWVLMKKTLFSILIITFIVQSNCFAINNKNKEVNNMNNEKIVQTAGRDNLGTFAPEFAHFNDDILFGENWNNQDLSLKTRCMITVVALLSQGITDSSMKYHLQNAKNNGVTKEEIAAAITHTAFYAGWPKAWATFNLAKEVWNDDTKALTEKEAYSKTIMFPIGEPNTAFEKYFIGQSYLAPVSTKQVKIYNVTFEPKCRNNWHIHKAKSGGGQILIAIGGRGYYQEWGKVPVEMKPGDVINIPPNVKHWHGAAPDSWFSHLAIEVDGIEVKNEWLEPVTEEYFKLR
jgi:4-carboxymuconolactone decarboxylase